MLQDDRQKYGIGGAAKTLSKLVTKLNKQHSKKMSNKIDEVDNKVGVSLGRQGYSYKYFSDYDVELKLEGDWLSVVVKDKEVSEDVD